MNTSRLPRLGLILAAWLALVAWSPAHKCQAETDGPQCDDNQKTNGYWWADMWVPGLPTISSWFTPAPIWSAGRAVWYAPMVMEATAEARGLSLVGYVDGVAMMSCADIGHPVWILRDGQPWEGPFLVVDCAQGDDIWPIIRYRREVVEVGWETHERWGVGIVEVSVSAVPPRALRWTDQQIYYPDWWLDRAEFAARDQARPLYLGGSCWRLQGAYIDFAGTTEGCLLPGT